MREAFAANFRAHLLFFRRSRWILGLGIAVVLFMALSLLPMLIGAFFTPGHRLELLGQAWSGMAATLYAFSSVLGLLVVATTLRDRSLKMIVTRSCPLSVWMISLLATCALVIVGSHLLLTALVYLGGWATGVSPQGGPIFLALASTLAAITEMAFLTCLGSWLHPVVALGLAVVVRHSTLAMLIDLTTTSSRSFVQALGTTMRVVDLFLPRSVIFESTRAQVAATWRVAPDAWAKLADESAYMTLAVTVFGGLAVAALRRKPLA